MKCQLSIILAFVLAHFGAIAQDSAGYNIVNYTAKHQAPVYAMQRYHKTWIVTGTTGDAKRGHSNTDIFTTDAQLKTFVPFAKEIMTDFDDGTPSFAGNIMYYTGVYSNFVTAGNANTKRLRIEIAETDGQHWKKKEEFPYNNPQYRMAHPAINKNGDMLVFVSDMLGGKGGMDLYYSINEGGSWSQPQNIFNLNTPGNELFPVFDKEDNLFFSSDSLAGLGGLDIYMAKNNGAGFGPPVNIKAPLNSAYDDFSLFSEDGLNTGYISSNRFGKHKKDDILFFERKQIKVQSTSLVITVKDKYTGTPLPYVSVTIKDNSGEIFHKGLTDLSGQLVLDEILKGTYAVQGMLNDVSTTMAKVGEADFTGDGSINKVLLHNDPRFTLAGLAKNTKTGVPLEGVTVSCHNATSGIDKKITTNADGSFLFQLEQNSDFEVQGSKKGWLSSERAEKTTRGLDRTTQLYVDLELKIEQPMNNGTITLRKIYYDYNKCAIRNDAAIELNRLVQLLNDHPDMTVELSSHTDARGTDDYNLTLSQCRAESAVTYLVQQGADKERLSAKGYGETRLLNKCKNGISCTEEEHEQNRRTEFTILSCSSCGE